tara:strand:+ start:3415 stop:4080 length:666 start_codon:yes stop_codon:yes gene_type:complete
MDLENKIKYKFKDNQLLIKSVTHKSYGYEKGKADNERLEFLGDSIIGFVVAKHLFKSFPEYDEGGLSKLKNQIVSTRSLYKIAKKLSLNKFILLGKGELKSRGRYKESNLAALLESLVGAIYIDSGIKEAEKFLKRFLLSEDLSKLIEEDYKSILQILSQKEFNTLPIYKTIKEEGPSHNKKFHVSVFINNIKHSTAIGKSKKIAQNNCAKKAIQKLAISL